MNDLLSSAALELSNIVIKQTHKEPGHKDHAHDHNEPGHKEPGHAAGQGGKEASAAAAQTCAGACLRNWKIGFAAILFVEGIVFGIVTLLLRRFACISTKRFFVLLRFINVTGGGIFLATGLLHILPEAVEKFAGKDHHGHGHSEPAGAAGAAKEPAHELEFPTAYAFLLLAYLVFLFFDRVLFSHLRSNSATPAATASGKEHSHSPQDEESGDSEQAEESSPFDVEAPRNGFASPRFLSALLAVVGIAAHSLFESIALGATDSFTVALNAFIAIAAHRWATSMVVGSKLAKDDLRAVPYVVLIFLFAVVAPVGIGIGFAAKDTSLFFQGVIFALSAGIFLYIGAAETVADEFSSSSPHKFIKFTLYVAGVGLMLIITGILFAKKVH